MFFLFFSSTELLRFYYWNINNCYKKFFLIFVSFLILSLCHDDVLIENFQKIQFISLFVFDDWRHLDYVFHSVQLRIPLISSFSKIYLCHLLLYSVFKMECTVLIFLFGKQLFKEHYFIHFILKNGGINNIFPSQTSFLLLSSDTHASFANRPIKFCGRKPNTWPHVFVVVVYVLPSKFSYTTVFFAVGLFSKFRGLYKGDGRCEFKSTGFPCQIAVTKT